MGASSIDVKGTAMLLVQKLIYSGMLMQLARFGCLLPWVKELGKRCLFVHLGVKSGTN